jgi:endonuclease-3|tara:strand:+ start:671 stop:1351 length:681 start_codon:yes stop_codon:yes gene_type:complete
MKSNNDITYIYEKLSSLYPNYSNKKPKAKIYAKAYTSLIGVMLSAQSQDKRTAIACRQLFALADTPEEMIKLSREEIIEAIRPAGLHNAKSKNILATSKILLEKFQGIVPQTQKELMSLPGVGRKSSDIMMRFVFGQPNIAVDTHVFRMLWRLGWADSLDEGKASLTVNQTTPDKYKYGAHMWLITHAKKVCRSRSPECDPCVISAACDKRDIDIPKSKLRQNLNS